MNIYNNTIVNQNGAYQSSGSLINGTQRISLEHQNTYWQQGNVHINKLALNYDDIIITNETIEQAIYVGRIPTHFGHFIMEGLARLCYINQLPNIPIIGYITDGFLPPNILPTPRHEIQWVINSITNNNKFIQINELDNVLVKTLIVPELPYHLSHNCYKPWDMSNLIETIVTKARLENPHFNNDYIIENLYLNRYEEVNKNTNTKKGYIYSNPYEPLRTQIAKVSYANNLHGISGSNTHISIFAKSNTNTFWKPRGSNKETGRNQLICDLIKSYNLYDDKTSTIF